MCLACPLNAAVATEPRRGCCLPRRRSLRLFAVKHAIRVIEFGSGSGVSNARNQRQDHQEVEEIISRGDLAERGPERR